MERVEVSLEGRDSIVIQTGNYAKFADASVVVTQGGTSVLVTICQGDKPIEGVDFLPLSVDYREQSSAWGKIPGGFIKREGKPTDREILVSRVIDRSIRPLFPEGYPYEVVVTALTLSADEKYDPDVLAIIGASSALALSSVPFETPIAGVRVALVDNHFILYPTYEERQRAQLELIVAVSKDSLIMVEGGAKEVPEETLLNALYFTLEKGYPLIYAQKELAEKGHRKKIPF
ncbi:MAG: polyribonucleotide nucleotidyltransferase, partial [Caldimicrobium sp.]